MNATVANALSVLPQLVAAGVDGVFLDGVVDFDIGCSPTPCNGHCNPTADINCTVSNCTHTPQPPYSTLHAQWIKLYADWFQRLKAVYPKLVWVNNLALEQEPFMAISNGRMYEGGDGLDVVYVAPPQSSLCRVCQRVSAYKCASCTRKPRPSKSLAINVSAVRTLSRAGRTRP